MTNYDRLPENYTRALTIAREALDKLPGEVAGVLEGMEQQKRVGDPTRAAIDLRRLADEVINPLALALKARIDSGHRELMELLKLRLQLLECLHTIASENQQFEKCATIGAEMEILNQFLIEDFLAGS
jgi:hypothetical protein